VTISEKKLTMSEKDPALRVYGQHPFNAGLPPDRLRASFITPNKLFYVRSHGDVPEIDPDAYRLVVTGSVQHELRLSLDDLRRAFPRSTVTATLQCAGNRRIGLMSAKPIDGELPWQEDAISNATWAGAPLSAVLQSAGVGPEGRRVAFTALDALRKEGKTYQVGSSIPIEQAMRPEVLLAYEMNGAPLPHMHGAPVRVVVPGYIGACSIKWLGEVRLQAGPSETLTQANDYKLFPPQVTKETVDWPSGLMLQELSVNSAISQPADGSTQPAGRVSVQGWAIAGGEREVARVDVSIDGGVSWTTANLLPEGGLGTWRFWECALDLPVGRYQIVARAYDTAANTQPEEPGPLWNFLGYMNNAWHRIVVEVR
jgi:sulfite oxidase